MNFDPTTFVYMGVPLIAMTFGTVEFIKTVFSMQGKAVTVLSFFTGFFYMASFQLVDILPEPFKTYFTIAYLGIAFGLSASGFYKFLSARLQKIN